MGKAVLTTTAGEVVLDDDGNRRCPITPLHHRAQQPPPASHPGAQHGKASERLPQWCIEKEHRRTLEAALAYPTMTL